MPIFKYKTTKSDGTIEESTIEAKDRFDVYKQARKEGRTIVSVSRDDKKDIKQIFNMDYINGLIGSVRAYEKILFAKNLAAMLDAGLSISRAIVVMEKQSKNQKLKNILGEVNGSIKKGEAFNMALSKFPKVFAPLFVSIVRVGEESGGLSESLRMIAKQMDSTLTLKKKIRGAMIYPGIIITALIIVGALMLVFIVPTLAETFEELGAELPKTTQAIIDFSNFLTNHYLIAVSIVAAFVAGFIFGLRTYKGKRVFEVIILKIPVIGTLVKEVNSARTSRTLGALLSSGVNMLSAIEITGDVIQNTHYKDILKEVGEKVRKGGKVSDVIIERENLYPIMMGEMISVGEETGDLSSMLFNVADYYEDEVSLKTKNMSTIVEPILMIIVGIGVGFFAVSMITPIYSLSDSI